MKTILSILFAFVTVGVFGQVLPNTFPIESTPDSSNFEVYSQKNGVPKRANLWNLKRYFDQNLTKSNDTLYLTKATGTIAIPIGDVGQNVTLSGDTLCVEGDCIVLADYTDVYTASDGIALTGNNFQLYPTNLDDISGSVSTSDTLILLDASSGVVVKIAVSALASAVTTSVTTNSTLSGNGSSGSPLSIAANGVATSHIQNDAVTGAKILNGTITNSDIASATIQFSRLQTIGNDKLLGRYSAGTGAIEVLSPGTGLEIDGSGNLNVVTTTDPSAEGFYLTVTQSAHGLSVLDPVANVGGTWLLANVSDEDSLHIGIVSEVISSNQFRVQFAGKLYFESHGYTVGAPYFVQDDGSYDLTVENGLINDIAFTAVTTDTLLIHEQRPVLPSVDLNGIYSGSGYVPSGTIAYVDNFQIKDSLSRFNLNFNPENDNLSISGDSLTLLLETGAGWVLTDNNATKTGLRYGANGYVTTSTSLADKAYVDAAVASGSVSDGDKGDIVVTGLGATWNIDTDAVTANEIAAGAVGSSEIATDAVGSDEVAAGAIGSSELASTTVVAGTYGSSTNVAVIEVDADGRITNASQSAISTHDAVTVTDGSTIDFTLATQNVTAEVKPESINATHIDTSAVTTSEILDGTVTTTDLAFTVNGGSGATNQVAYWTATNTLAGDSDLQFDGTRVGIGQAPGTGKLEITGIGTGTNNTLLLQGSSGIDNFMFTDGGTSGFGGVPVNSYRIMSYGFGSGSTTFPFSARNGSSATLFSIADDGLVFVAGRTASLNGYLQIGTDINRNQDIFFGGTSGANGLIRATSNIFRIGTTTTVGLAVHTDNSSITVGGGTTTWIGGVQWDGSALSASSSAATLSGFRAAKSITLTNGPFTVNHAGFRDTHGTTYSGVTGALTGSNVGFLVDKSITQTSVTDTSTYKVNHVGFADRGTYTNIQYNTPVIGFEARPTISGTVSYAGFRGRVVSGTRQWNLKMSGSANNWLAGNTVVGTDSIPTAMLDITGSTSAGASLRMRSGTAPSSPNDGDAWNDSTQKTFSARLAGITQNFIGEIFTGTANASVSNTVTETSITPTGVGTLTLPANTFVAGKTIRIKAFGTYTTDATVAPTLQLRFNLGSTNVIATSANTLATSANGAWESEFIVTCRTTGASGTFASYGVVRMNNTEATVDKAIKVTATPTIDTTASQAMTVSAQWGTADTDNVITTILFTAEIIN